MKRHNIIQTGSGRTVDIDNQNKQTDHCNFKALNGTVETITLEAKGLNKFDPMTFLKSKYDDIKKAIKNAITEKCGMKWYMSLKLKMSRRKGDDMETAEQHFSGKCQTARDHCHVTGKFRGAAHNECNINYKYTGRIPVIIHNARGYDTHLIMQAIGKIQGKQLKCIPNNMEKYILFSLGCMDFIDSFQFMSSLLEKLVENLAKEG
jgi:hypothetical protein